MNKNLSERSIMMKTMMKSTNMEENNSMMNNMLEMSGEINEMMTHTNITMMKMINMPSN